MTSTFAESSSRRMIERIASQSSSKGAGIVVAVRGDDGQVTPTALYLCDSKIWISGLKWSGLCQAP